MSHAFRFAKDPQTVFVHGQKRFGRVGRPYGLTIAGRTLYVLTDPQVFSNVYRNAATFTFDPLVEQVYRAFQLSEAAIRRLYRTPLSSGAESGVPSPPAKDAVNISHQMIFVGKTSAGNLNTNTPKACLGLLCHILFNLELVQIIRNETSASFASDTFDYDIIERSQPLHGIRLETLRLSTSALSVRYITQDFEMKGLKFGRETR
ncbi:MAG: hypothetical protein Q9181_006952 [Wetmoreana brouardii]